MPTCDELQALLVDLDAGTRSAAVLHGEREGWTDLTLRLPTETVRRFWSVAMALRAADETPPGPVVMDPDRSPQHREAAGW